MPPIHDEGIVREARRPTGWQAQGPVPAGHRGEADLFPQAGEDLCYLSGDWRIFQRQRGHRWSLDDLMTAHYAVEKASEYGIEPATTLDLGCGIGSVLMMIAWSFPQAHSKGIEAQALSVGLARRSLRFNGADTRVEVVHGDLRGEGLLAQGARFPLITGTPPYIPIGAGTPSERDQCEPCRFETRGGIEDYCEAAARALEARGIFVVCEGANPHARTFEAARAAGLRVASFKDVIPKEGKDALFTLFVMTHDTWHDGPPRQEPSIMVRLADDRRSAEYLAVREAMGMPSWPTTPK